VFEKYNEKARRALFFARYEASKLGSRVIESEHILLGILREGEESVTELFRRLKVKPEVLRKQIEGEKVFVERISSTAELPLSEESKKVLAYGSHEAESMLHPSVGSEHLLIGLLRVDGCLAMRTLTQHGLDLYSVREEVLAIAKEREATQQKEEQPFLAEYARDLAVSPTHLNRIVHQVTGQSASHLVNERMLREARRMLLYTSLSAAQIAYDLGFSDPAHFSRVFTKGTGMPPRAFRKQLGDSA